MINKQLFPVKIEENVPLSELTTFGIGGPAKFFAQVTNQEELVKTIIAARKSQLDIFVLGGGSNVLISDNGFPGLVIQNNDQQVTVKNNKIITQSGTKLANLVALAKEKQLSGLECCFGIPGTIGGAVRGNAGAGKDVWINRVVETVTILDQDNQLISLSNKDCLFDYRSSRFSQNEEIILQVVLNLQPQTSAVISQNEDFFWSARKQQPQGKSAGSIFKNPPHNSAGYLIDQAGLRGRQIGQAQISPDHANFIINHGQARAKDVLTLIREAQKAVEKKFALRLQLEIKLIGFTKEEIKDII
jgi:UDP-N-acetylmuramate dehydrogenase